MKTGEIAKAIQIVVFFIMLMTAGVFAFKPLPWLALIPAIAAISYWNMIHDKEKTEMYRYGDWILSTPLMLLALLRQNNVTNEYIQIVLVLNVIMITCGFYATKEYDKTRKAVWFLLGCIIFIPIAYVLYSLPIEKQVAMFLLGTWCVYPIIWTLKETHILKPDISNIAYALMDTISKVGLLSQIHM
jgi:bacteriorhodopsin